MTDQQLPVIISGAGLAGSLMAVYLAKKGFHVEIYERRPDMRRADISAGKSINLAMSVRGLHALREVGLEDEILSIALPMRGRMMHSTEGELTFQPYSKDEKTAINSVSRGELNKKLMTLAESHGKVNIYFGMRCVDVDFEAGKITFRDEQTGEEKTVQGQAIIGADGAFSGVRQEMMKTSLFNYSQDYLQHGYKELEIPPGDTEKFRIANDALHIWPRSSYMMIALPNIDGSFTCTLFYPMKGRQSFETLETEAELMAFFNEQFPDAVPQMPGLVKDFFGNPTGSLVTVRCFPWSAGKATLIGDAAHAIVPFYGQGMNAAFEDCSVLSHYIDRFGADWPQVFEAYEKVRKPNADAIADMAIENFIEMRDSVGDEKWLLKKQVEHALERHFEGRYISRYEMVSFTRIPYAEAQRIGRVNQEILGRLCRDITDAGDVDMKLADQLISEKLGDVDFAQAKSDPVAYQEKVGF